MAVPTVHLNGTSKEGLLSPIKAAKSALRTAIEALEQAAPNARDYYVQGPDAYRVAEQEHVVRLTQLRLVQSELSELYGRIYEQGK